MKLSEEEEEGEVAKVMVNRDTSLCNHLPIKPPHPLNVIRRPCSIRRAVFNKRSLLF